MKADSTALENAIKAAFATVPYPGDDRLFNPPVEGDPEINEVASVLRGNRWDELSPELVVRAGTGLPFLPVEAFAYYLPGYMLLVLRDEKALGLVPLPFIMTLCASTQGPASIEERRSFRELTAQLTAQQRAVVVAFLRYRIDKYKDYGSDVDRTIAEIALADWVEALAADSGPPP